MANVSCSIQQTMSGPSHVSIGTIIQSVVDNNTIVYKISPDPVDGAQPRDEGRRSASR